MENIENGEKIWREGLEDSYEYLEGKKILYNNTETTVEAMVALVDSDIGITIVDANNKDDYLICMSMPKSPRWKEEWNTTEEYKDSNKEFHFFVEGIKKGVIELPTDFYGLFGPNPTSAHCPF